MQSDQEESSHIPQITQKRNIEDTLQLYVCGPYLSIECKKPNVKICFNIDRPIKKSDQYDRIASKH